MQDYDLDAAIRKVHDFPRAGILFYDVTSILTNPEAFQFCVDRMDEIYADQELDAVACIEARGFVFCSSLCLQERHSSYLGEKEGQVAG